MKLVASQIALALLLAAPSALAHGPYLVLHDDGTMAGKLASPLPAQVRIINGYKAAGLPIPDFMSVWTDFSMDQNDFETLFDLVGNDVKGIGLQQAYGGDGTKKSPYPPLKSILLHNNVTALETRASVQNATVDGFAQYLFLLELSHNWGPNLQLVPSGDGGGPAAGELTGFPFHWSFFLNPGGPAGGNAWQDDGDAGSWTISGQTPKALKYSTLDLYMMGLVAKSDVPPFGVLENTVVPPTPTDPFFKGPYSAQSFPWFGSTPFTVQGTMRTITIDDVVAANGERTPDVTTSQKAFTLGVVLVVGQNDTDDQIASAEATMDPIAPSLPAAFQDATGGKATMSLVTLSDDTDAGAPPDDAGTTSSDQAAPSSDSGGCNVTDRNEGGGWSWLVSALTIAVGGAFARRRGLRLSRK